MAGQIYELVLDRWYRIEYIGGQLQLRKDEIELEATICLQARTYAGVSDVVVAYPASQHHRSEYFAFNRREGGFGVAKITVDLGLGELHFTVKAKF